MTTSHLAEEAERIRDDVRELIDWLESTAHPEVTHALSRVCGRLQSLEDHLKVLAAEAVIQREISKLAVQCGQMFPPPRAYWES